MNKEELFETFGDINSQYVREAHMNKKKKEKFVWTKWMSVAACFLIISVVSIPVVRHFIQTENNDIYTDEDTHGMDESGDVSAKNNQLEELSNEKEVNLIVNKVDGLLETMLDADIKVTTYGKLPEDIWQRVTDEFYEFTGVRYEEFTSALSVAGEIFNFYSLSTPMHKGEGTEKEYRIHDYVFGYRTQNGGEATIALSSVGAPFRDYYFVCENTQLSKIGDVSLDVFEYEGMYIVQFSAGDLSYDIETNHMNLEELETLLLAVLSVTEETSESVADEVQGTAHNTDIEDVPADTNGDYYEAVESNDVTKDTAEFFGGSYLDDNGKFNVVLTEDTVENRASICKELGISESDTVFREGTYTLSYLTELQAKISNAMINKEIPFVISSGVYETVNKIKVRSTSNDEAELAKLYALDTIGGAIEVEYVSENIISPEICLQDK